MILMPLYECLNNGAAIFADHIGVVHGKFISMVFIAIAASFKGYIYAEKIIVNSAVAAFSV